MLARLRGVCGAVVSPRKPRVPRRLSEHGSRWYDVDGTRLLSVTSVLGLALNKPALPAWAARTVAEHAMDSLPKLIKMSRAEKPEAIAWLKGQPYAERDAAALAGTAMHDAAEAHVLGKPYTWPDDGTPAARTLARFRAFLDDWTPEFEATEATVANLSDGYAGTLDAIVRIPALVDEGLLVLDYKTGKTGPYPEWALQLAAYQRAEFLWLPNGERVPIPATTGCAVLRLRPDFYALHVMSAPAPYEAFRSALHLAKWAVSVDERGGGVPAWGSALPSPNLTLTDTPEGELPCPS